MTRPLDYIKPKQKNMWFLRRALRKYPEIIRRIERRHEVYNQSVADLKALAAQGRALLVAPDDCCGVSTLTKDKDEPFCGCTKKAMRTAKKPPLSCGNKYPLWKQPRFPA